MQELSSNQWPSVLLKRYNELLCFHAERRGNTFNVANSSSAFRQMEESRELFSNLSFNCLQLEKHPLVLEADLVGRPDVVAGECFYLCLCGWCTTIPLTCPGPSYSSLPHSLFQEVKVELPIGLLLGLSYSLS